jgi:putative molybdopterin biosynthesis protein
MRKIYLNKISLAEAQQKLLNNFKDLRADKMLVEVADSIDRVTAEAVYARRSAPNYYASAMDGIAVNSNDLLDASERNPVSLKDGEEAVLVDTGDPIPAPFDAVVMIEEVNQLDDGTFLVEKGVPPWNNVRSIGESVVKGQLIIPINHKLSDYDIGGLLEAGVDKIKVYQRPKISIIPTGNELVEPSSDPESGQLVEFNSKMISASLTKWGASPNYFDILPDKKNLIKEKIISENKKSDLTIIIAGSSAGEEDYTFDILKELGDVLVHGVNIMPGKPFILAKIEGKPVIGLPGYPLSALFDNYLFVREIVYLLQGLKAPDLAQIEAEVRRKLPSEIGLEEFVRVNLTEIDNNLVAVPRGKGSASMESIIRAQGVMRIPENKEGLSPGDKSLVILTKEKSEIFNNLLLIGSHDLSLDLITNELKKRGANFSLSLQSVGSMAGLMALKRCECQLAGAHLLNPKDGEYNIDHIKRIFKEKDMALINLVYREQGFYVKKSNPKNIKSISDLIDNNISFINRQRGAGTRVLFDYLLDEKNISPDEINGYNQEEYTHIAAAVAVGQGSADVALGIESAANVVGVDFIPITEERYDLILAEKLLEDDRIKYLIETLRDSELQEKIRELGGYRTDDTGLITRLNSNKNRSDLDE